MKRFFTITGILILCIFTARLLGFAKFSKPPAATAREAINEITRGAFQLDLSPLWDNTPKSWQERSDELLQKFASSVDPKLWEEVFEALEKLTTLATQPDAPGIDNSSLLRSYLAEQEADSEHFSPQDLREYRMRIGAILLATIHSPLADSDNLKRVDLRDLAAVWLPAAEDELRKLPGYEEERLLGPEVSLQLQALRHAADQAQSDQTEFVLSEEERLTFYQIEGAWVADGYRELMLEGLENLEGTSSYWMGAPDSQGKQDLYAISRLINTGLDELLDSTQDPAQFDAAIGRVQAGLAAWLLKIRLREMLK